MDGIANYAFYGEDDAPPRPEILHCETLRSRAVVHNWRFRPHRHHAMHQFFWINSGDGLASIDGIERRIEPATAICVPPMTVHGFVFEPGIEGWVITIPRENLERLLENSNTVMARLRTPVMVRASSSAEAVFAPIAEEFARFSEEREQALASLAGLLAVWFAREIAASPGFAPDAPNRGRELTLRFIEKIEAEMCNHLPVARYASALGVTPTHLSRVCQRVAGRSASALIHDRLALEGRRQLTYTARSVSEIAYALGFQDPAHFSKFFRNQTGQSPSQFKASAQGRILMPDRSSP
jgi:AraC family transcriptional activator of pobA